MSDLYLVTYSAGGHNAGLYPFHISEVEGAIALGVDYLRSPTASPWVAVGLAHSKREAREIVEALEEELEALGRPVAVVGGIR